MNFIRRNVTDVVTVDVNPVNSEKTTTKDPRNRHPRRKRGL